MALSRSAQVWRLPVVLLLFIFAFATVSIAESIKQSASQGEPFYEPKNQHAIHDTPSPSQETSNETPKDTPSYSLAETNILRDLHSTLSTMQDHYFEVWLGKYTSAIDWTGAVMSTYVSSTLSSLSRSLSYTMPGTFDKSRKLDVEAQRVENEINKYFAQTSAYYFGEDHFAIRMQAFDDMLWVVLGWLEATRFVESHSVGHYTPNKAGGKEWHASQFVPAFSHRSRVFYELAEKGWDWRLCGGGMTWNPSLLPYKNAITNQLFISASISMYLHFAGDSNCSPFILQHGKSRPHEDQLYDDCDSKNRERYDPVYLANALNAYNWLKQSNMTNAQGLYVDGFHIGGYRTNHSKTTCDERNEMVYTYNQGVLLSGLRGLWEATGETSYLEDGHELIRNVVWATGWKKTKSYTPSSTRLTQENDKNAADGQDVISNEWAGLGYNGILTELCDPSGHCNQDGQTFKGIFFHHLTAFCEPLPTRPTRLGKTHAASREVAMLHDNSCRGHTAWVVHNAQAALKTRDSEGKFGCWWGAPEFTPPSQSASRLIPVLPENATDYRNVHVHSYDDLYTEISLDERIGWFQYDSDKTATRNGGDLNDRGRGRTVETQGSGLAVVRAMWEFLKRTDGNM
ncbi:Glycoside hydrolase family 76 protein [Pyrenophora tritici-repentis]|uniref:Glycoside hydrolase family 76 protein n=1 Tax=Pyrenophora tritici-repentis TaxID=45151 RepID=A0A2W1DBD2_9PLEO|nr:glycoside hydrolase family 76 protein [Pyrenophora tritici-repentis]KAI0572238.1 Glycoside hydrolase family 76 protein [Pyrenophora tritici-repentis]KAI0579353.1 Glycoside hydrolase family 76 protein [Pyrenophora tritici-repentis]KAI0608169.1 Glycoside hydrolase family 76 protein [Pyrenophora tritici-repentis]KAI0620497.1 Glycoside hydrolase family 76 protein [Pyrenophora tritici-repentis]